MSPFILLHPSLAFSISLFSVCFAPLLSCRLFQLSHPLTDKQKKALEAKKKKEDKEKAKKEKKNKDKDKEKKHNRLTSDAVGNDNDEDDDSAADNIPIDSMDIAGGPGHERDLSVAIDNLQLPGLSSLLIQTITHHSLTVNHRKNTQLFVCCLLANHLSVTFN